MATVTPKARLTVTPIIEPTIHEYTLLDASSGNSYKVRIYEATGSKIDKKALTETDWKSVAEKAITVYKTVKANTLDLHQLQLSGDLSDAAKTTLSYATKANAEKNPDVPADLTTILDDKSIDPAIFTKFQDTIKALAPIWSKITVQSYTPASSTTTTTSSASTLWTGKLPDSFGNKSSLPQRHADIAVLFKGKEHDKEIVDTVATYLDSIKKSSDPLVTAADVRKKTADYIENTMAAMIDGSAPGLDNVITAVKSIRGTKMSEKLAFSTILLKDFEYGGKKIKDINDLCAGPKKALTSDDKKLFIMAYAYIIGNSKNASEDAHIPGHSTAVLSALEKKCRVVVFKNDGAKPKEYLLQNPDILNQEIDPRKCIFVHQDPKGKITGFDRTHINIGADQAFIPLDKTSSKAAADTVTTVTSPPLYLTDKSDLSVELGTGGSLRCLDRSISDQINQMTPYYPTTEALRAISLNYQQQFTREIAANYILNNLDTLSTVDTQFKEFVASWTEAKDDPNLASYFNKDAFAAINGIINGPIITDDDQKKWILKAYAYYILNPNTQGDGGLLLAYSLATNQQIAVIANFSGVDAIRSVYPGDKPIDPAKCAFIYRVPGHYTSTNRVKCMATLESLAKEYNKNDNKKLNEFMKVFEYSSSIDYELKNVYDDLELTNKTKIMKKLFEAVQAKNDLDPEAAAAIVAKSATKVDVVLKLANPNYAEDLLKTPGGRKLLASLLRNCTIVRKDIE